MIEHRQFLSTRLSFIGTYAHAHAHAHTHSLTGHETARLCFCPLNSSDSCPQHYISTSSLPRVVKVPKYPWQIDLLKRGFVRLSHAMYGCRLDHLYLPPTSCLGRRVSGNQKRPHRNFKERFQEMAITNRPTSDDGSTTK